jgi:hypothetical protein
MYSTVTREEKFKNTLLGKNTVTRRVESILDFSIDTFFSLPMKRPMPKKTNKIRSCLNVAAMSLLCT